MQLQNKNWPQDKKQPFEYQVLIKLMSFDYRINKPVNLMTQIPINLTHWGRMMYIYICVSNLAIIGPDNGLSLRQRQAIIWTNAGILLIETKVTNCIEF